MKNICSVHTHSTLCDGKDTLVEMARAAFEAGAVSFGASGHSHTPMPWDAGCVLPTDMTAYREEVLRLREAYGGRMDVLLGIEPYHLWKDPENLGAGDVKDGLPMRPDRVAQTAVFEKFAERYPNLRCIARHVREAPSSSENSLKAYLWMEGETVESPSYTFQILDRVGGGDAFAAGLIYALLHRFGPQEAVNFAVAASVLKHSIAGDACLMEDLETLRGLENSGGDIRR